MQTYKASEELAQILINNGFSEITSSKFPDHQKRIDKDGYQPGKAKRAFGINSQDLVIFDYALIKPCHKGGCDGPEMKDEFSENEIKSIIAFFKMPFQSRNAFKRNGSHIPTLHDDYRYMKEHPDFNKQKRHIVIDAFENVII